METKICSQCGKTLSISAFRLKKRRPGQNPGLTSKCKNCLNAIARQKYQKHNVKILNKYVCKQGHKLCSKCKKELPLINFHKCCKNPTANWHYDSQCKKCKKHKPNYIRPSQSSIEHKLIESKRKRAKNGIIKSNGKELLFKIGVDDIRKLIKRSNNSCEVTGVELENDLGKPLSPSIDRIDINKGYEIDNIRLTSLLYNLGRNTWNDLDCCAALYGFNFELNQNWAEFISATINRRRWSTQNGIYTNPGSLRKYEFDIDKNDLLSLIDNPLTCKLTDVQMSNKSDSPLSPSLDRINSSKGYVKNNIQIISKFVNLSKWKFNKDEYLKAIHKIRESQINKGLYKVNNLYLFADELAYRPHAIYNLLTKEQQESVRPKNCNIKLIDNKIASEFYDIYHYMGGCASSFNIGVYKDNVLLACMSLRKPSGINCKEDWEISRMASNSNYKVHGIWSYIIKWIKNNNLINGQLITFSDNRMFNGAVYSKIGMEIIKEVPKNYAWMSENLRRYHRRQDKSEKEMINIGFNKVWDMGKKKWSMIII